MAWLKDSAVAPLDRTAMTEELATWATDGDISEVPGPPTCSWCHCWVPIVCHQATSELLGPVATITADFPTWATDGA
jgi:hypothetical protein